MGQLDCGRAGASDALAGLSDKVILAVAQHSSQGLPVLSGVTLAKMKIPAQATP